MAIMKGFVAPVVCLAVFCTGLHAASLVGLADDDWDQLVFTQEWPESVCIQGNLTKEYKCSIPANVTSWTVHGIWPTLNGTKGPNYCNDSDKFDPQKVQPILGELLAHWPNLHTDDTEYSFWEHEWDKHGTCAGSLPVLKGELNYFSFGLTLQKKFNLFNFLSSRKLVPSTSKGYDYNELLKNIVTGLGKQVELVCFYEKKFGVQYLTQVEVCLDKNFQLVDCAHSTGGCIESHPVMYPPIHHPMMSLEPAPVRLQVL